MNPSPKTTTLLGLLIVLLIIAGLLLSLSTNARQQHIRTIGSFEDCALAGYPIMETYPEQCRTPDGRTFVNEEKDQTPPAGGAVGTESGGCKIGGCSAQLCGEAGDDLMSNCEYRAEYGCYKAHSSCERQANGKCGWTPTSELQKCLASPASLDATIQVTQ